MANSKQLPEDAKRLLDQGLLARIAELSREIEGLRAQNEALTKQVEALTRERNRNSSNSNKPPSSDNFGDRKKIRRRKKRTGRKPCGQPGHKGKARKLLPADKVDDIAEHYPDLCEICQQTPPKQAHGKPYVHQVVDLRLEGGGRYVVEHRCYAVDCTCGAVVPAPIEKVPFSSL